ncbi:inositol monophosphatase [Candidatus Bipolaricaulota bacterium]|nr:inositol monophosphatase [Candidatus Bipolaricaulota bacterium]
MEEDLLEVAREAAEEAGELLLEGREKKREVSHKSGPTDLVTQFDHASQDLIVSKIREKFPDHSILAEEEVEIEGNDIRWIIDPVDGTTNFVYDYPLFSVSIAVEIRGDTAVGVVHLPVLCETFWAIDGKGARLNGDRVRVSNTGSFEDSLLVTGFPYEKDLVPQAIEVFSKLTRKTRGIRRDGSAAIDLSFVAAGRLDGFWELDLSPWDIAAGSLIVREAGGTVTDFQGGEHDIYDSAGIVASNGLIHEQFIKRLS